MDSLPPEILREILHIVAEDSPKRGYAAENDAIPMAQLAAVSPHWQVIVEEVLFGDLEVSADELQDLALVFENDSQNKHRQQSLRHLAVNLYLSELDSEPDADPNVPFRAKTRRELWACLHNAVYDLWSRLYTWRDNLSRLHLTIRFGRHPFLWFGGHYRTSYLLPLMKLSVPTMSLPALNSFNVEGGESRIHPGDIARLARSFDSIDEINFQIDDESNASQIERRDARNGTYFSLIKPPPLNTLQKSRILTVRSDLVEALETLPPSVHTVQLWARYCPNLNQGWYLDRLLVAGLDEFSAGLRDFSTRLTRFTLEANQLSLDILWPQKSGKPTNVFGSPSWPNLKYLEIKTTCEQSDGSYCLMAEHPQVHEELEPAVEEDSDDDDDSDGESDTDKSSEEATTNNGGDVTNNQDHVEVANNQNNAEVLTANQLHAENDIDPMYHDSETPRTIFRVRPCHEFLDSLAISAARAMNVMPKLESMTYHMRYEDAKSTDYNRGHGIYFRAKGCKSNLNNSAEGIGMDRRSYETSRLEYAFFCSQGQLRDWTPPASTRLIWMGRHGLDLEQDIVSYKRTVDGQRRWIRVRDGVRLKITE